MVDATVYHLPMPTEITPVVSSRSDSRVYGRVRPGVPIPTATASSVCLQVSTVGPLHMGAGPVAVPQGKYVTTEEVVYHHTDGGAVKYSLPARRSYRDPGTISAVKAT